MSDAITPFHIAVADADLADLHERLARTRWPERETVDDWSQGIPLAYVQEVCEYWRDDLRLAGPREAAQPVPAVPHVAERRRRRGLGIHFIHARSAEPDALPLVLTHGWPGSIVEFLKVIGPLTDPAAHGGDAADAFHVVARRCPATASATSPPAPAGASSASPPRGTS